MSYTIKKKPTKIIRICLLLKQRDLHVSCYTTAEWEFMKQRKTTKEGSDHSSLFPFTNYQMIGKPGLLAR